MSWCYVDKNIHQDLSVLPPANDTVSLQLSCRESKDEEHGFPPPLVLSRSGALKEANLDLPVLRELELLNCWFTFVNTVAHKTPKNGQGERTAVTMPTLVRTYRPTVLQHGASAGLACSWAGQMLGYCYTLREFTGCWCDIACFLGFSHNNEGQSTHPSVCGVPT